MFKIYIEESSSSANPKNIKLTCVRSHTNLARPFYTEEKESTQEQDESPPMSPTYSQMINTISYDDKDFEINKDLLRKDFYSEVNKKRNVWFFSTVPKDIRTLYQEEFYTYLIQERKNIKFWIWFELFKQDKHPDYPCKRINNTSTKVKVWKTSDNIVIESIHPPKAKIEKNINGTIIRASPFKTKLEDKGTARAVDIRRIMEQNNYTNMILKTIGDQLNRVEEIIEIQDHIKNSFVKNDSKPLFKPFEFSKKFQENPHIDQDFIDRISQKVKNSLIIPETPQPFSIPKTPRRINMINTCSNTRITKMANKPFNQMVFRTKDHYDTSQEQKHVLDTLTIQDLQEEVR